MRQDVVVLSKPERDRPSEMQRGRAQEDLTLKQHLDESTSSMAFVGLLLTVNFAVLATALGDLRDNPIVAVLFFESLIASFYASIAYAVVAGQVRAGHPESAFRSILVGNVLSEWCGVYPLILAFAPLIQSVTDSASMCIAAILANLFGYAAYAATDISLLSRFFPGGWGWAAHGAIMVFIVLGGVSAAVGCLPVQNAVLVAAIMYCMAVGVCHWRSGEGPSARFTV